MFAGMPRALAPPRGRRHRRGTLIAHAALLAALFTGIVLRLALPPPAHRTPDEAAYTLYAAAIRHDGLTAQRTLIANYMADSLLAEAPRPTRVGMSWLGAFAMWLTGSNMVTSVVRLSMFCSILQLAVLATIARAALGPWVATLAVAFLAASPLDLAMARRAWADGVLGLLASLMLWVFLRAAAKPGGRVWPVILFALGALAALVKESGLVLLAIAAFGLAFVEWTDSRGWRRPVLALIGAMTAVVASVAILTLLCGGVTPWITAFEHVARPMESSDYLRRYQTGSPLYYARGLAILQPLPWLLGAAGALLAAARAPLLMAPWARPAAVRVLASAAWLTLAVGALACAYGQKNLRFLSPIYAPIALLAAALAGSALSWLRGRLPRGIGRVMVAVLGIALAVSLYADLRRFANHFLRRDVPDLATPWFTGQDAGTPR